MKKLIFTIAIFNIVLFCGYANGMPQSTMQNPLLQNQNTRNTQNIQETQADQVNLAQFPRVNAWIQSRTVTEQERNYYGADLSNFPPNVRDWIINSAFTRERMEGNPRLDTLRVWWSDDNNTVHGEGTNSNGLRRITGRYGGSSQIYDLYGEYARFHTLRHKWELTQEVERMLRTDIMFAEIIEFAMQLSEEIEYDWASFAGYGGARVIRTPGKRYAVCDGYAEEVMEKALRLNSVQAVQKWTGPNHAWNVLILTDGRTLFFDLTWFDNEHINHDTGRIYQTDDYNWANITFNEELFRFSNVGYGTRVFAHNSGRLAREIRK